MRRNILIRFIISKLAPFLSRHPGLFLILGVVYLFVPLDILPEAFAGPLGYLDDIVALLLGATLFNRFRPGGSLHRAEETAAPRSPREILGVPAGASKEEITAAYRKKMTEYHPDKVAHLGEELKKTAHKESLEIQQAYEKLMKGF